MELIDKSAVVAEIERLKNFYDHFDDNIQSVAKYNVLVDVLSFLNTLEVKEVDLEKEFKDFINCDNGREMFDIAKHFYELGLNKC